MLIARSTTLISIWVDQKLTHVGRQLRRGVAQRRRGTGTCWPPDHSRVAATRHAVVRSAMHIIAQAASSLQDVFLERVLMPMHDLLRMPDLRVQLFEVAEHGHRGFEVAGQDLLRAVVGA